MLAAIFATPTKAQVVSVALQPPERDFGYFPGDLLTATASIVSGADTRIDPRTLPVPGPVSPAIDVREVQLAQNSVPNGWLTRITVVYQNFFSPEQVLREDVPGYTLGFLRNGARLPAPVPGFSFAASTFRHDLQPVMDPAALRPDHPAILEDVAGPRLTVLTGGVIALLALLWLLSGAGWRILPARRALPFAQAARSMPHRAPADAQTAAREALLTLHRAFDATAGKRILADDLDAFFAQFPSFVPLRDETERFFAASRQVFFGSVATAPELAWLRRLARGLARAEAR